MFYYLNSRYYDEYTGRFISPDRADVICASPNALTDKNLYSYCDNNPVMRRDDGGQFWDTLFDVVRIRVEQHNPTPNYSGPENPFHTSPHFHIDRKVNITTGKWKKTYTGLMEMFYD